MKLAMIAFAFLAVATASAQAIQKWKTPDGKIFFGDKPPAGSTSLGDVTAELGTGVSDAPPIATASKPDAAHEGAPRSDGGAIIDQRKLDRAALAKRQEQFAAIRDPVPLVRMMIVGDRRPVMVEGRVRNATDYLLRNVRVCVNGTSPCYSTSPSTLKPNDEAEFSFDFGNNPQTSVIGKGDPDF